MAENIDYVKLSGRMKSVAKDKVLAETNSIFDENQKKFQELINSETRTAILNIIGNQFTKNDKCIASDGQERINAGLDKWATDYILINDHPITIFNALGSKVNATVAFYDEQKKRLQPTVCGSDYDHKDIVIASENIPSEASYYRASGYADTRITNDDIVTIVNLLTNLEKKHSEDFQNINSSVGSLTIKTDELKTAIKTVCGNHFVKQGEGIAVDGNNLPGVGSNRWRTNYITLDKKNPIVIFNAYGGVGPTVAFYNQNKIFIEEGSITDSKYDKTTCIVSPSKIPQNAYYFRANGYADTRIVNYAITDLINDLSRLSTLISENSVNINHNSENITELDGMIRDILGNAYSISGQRIDPIYGTPLSSQDRFITEFYLLNKNEPIIIYDSYGAVGGATVSFYDAEKKYIKDMSIVGTQYDKKNKIVINNATYPDNAVYFRSTGYSESRILNENLLSVIIKINEYQTQLILLSSNIEKLEGDIRKIEAYNKKSYIFGTTGKGIDRSSGIIYTNKDCCVTDFIRIRNANKITVTGRDFAAWSILQFYDKNRENIAPLYESPQNNNSLKIDIPASSIPSNAEYVRAAAKIADNEKNFVLYIEPNSVDTNNNILNIEDNVADINQQQNGLNHICLAYGSGSAATKSYSFADIKKGTRLQCTLKSDTGIAGGITTKGNAINVVARRLDGNLTSLRYYKFIDAEGVAKNPVVPVGFIDLFEIVATEDYDMIGIQIFAAENETVELGCIQKGINERVHILEESQDSCLKNNKIVRLDHINKIMRTIADFKTPSVGQDWNDLFENLYDTLVAEHPEYVTKYNMKYGLGIPNPNPNPNVLPDLSDITVPAYMNGENPKNLIFSMPMYIFKPSCLDEESLVKIFIVSGTHGENVGLWNTYEFMKVMCKNLDEEDILQLHMGCEFIVLPNSNPTTYALANANIGRENHGRTNINGVDLNRNMPTKEWIIFGEGTDYYSGPSAGSEYESQLVKKIIDFYIPDIFIDSHSSAYDNKNSQMWFESTSNQPMSYTLGKGAATTMWNFIKDIDKQNYPQDYVTQLADATSTSIAGKRARYAAENGILSMTTEGFDNRSYTDGEKIPREILSQDPGSIDTDKNKMISIAEFGLELLIKRMVQFVSLNSRKLNY